MPTAAVAGAFVAPMIGLHVLGAVGRASRPAALRKPKKQKKVVKRRSAALPKPKRKVSKMAKKRKATTKKRKRSTSSKPKGRTKRKSPTKKARRVTGIGIGRASDFDSIVGFRLRN